MVPIFTVVSIWLYIAAACFCARRLNRLDKHLHQGWMLLVAAFWPLCLVLWIACHSITHAVDWAEKILDEKITNPGQRTPEEHRSKSIPD